MKPINNDEEYNTLLMEIENYLQKVTKHGSFNSLTSAEADNLHQLSLRVEAYEKSIPLMPIRTPDTLAGMVQVKMAERRMKQQDMAKYLGVSSARFSEFMNGKRRITIDLAKKLHERLGINPAFILEKA